MKAKVGNRVVNVIPDDGRFLDLSDMAYYDAADLSFDFDDDWQAFRREAAKDILAGMMTRIPPCDYGISHAEVMATYAVLYANKLIDELKIDKK